MRKRLLFCLLFLLMGPLVYSAPAADFARITHPEKLTLSPSAVPAASTVNEAEAKERAMQSLANAPLLFVENKGQVADAEGKLMPQVLFTARSKGAEVTITATSITYTFSKVEGLADPMQQRMMPLSEREKKQEAPRYFSEQMTLNLVGANPAAQAELGEANAYFERFYMAHCPNGITARSFERVRIKEVYPGVDWVLYSNGSGLKYDFVLAKASLASQIKLKVTGAKTNIDSEGNLVMAGELGKIVEDKPVSFQNGREVASRFVQRRNGEIGFQVEGARADLPLTIDPSVVWSTYCTFNAIGADYGSSCSIDPQGNVYLASSNTGAPSGLSASVAFTKLSSAGVRLFTIYLNGTAGSYISVCSTDGAGNLFLTGFTEKPNLPTINAFQPAHAGDEDAFLAKFSSSGTILWCTYFGGSLDDMARYCATDAAGNVIITGQTKSVNLPVQNASQPTLSSQHYDDAFIAKFSSNGSLLWSTYFGGSYSEVAYSCSVSLSGDIAIVGSTLSPDLPVLDPFKTTFEQFLYDIFVARYNTNGLRLWSKRAGGTSHDEALSSKFDQQNNLYVGGSTFSSDFTLLNAVKTTEKNGDAFLMKISDSGALVWSTFHGGPHFDFIGSIDIDTNGFLYVAGAMGKWHYLDPRNINGYDHSPDAFVARYDTTGQRHWTVVFTGNSAQNAKCALDGRGNLYVGGATASSNFFVFNAQQPTLDGWADGFIMKLNQLDQLPHLVVQAGEVRFITDVYSSVTVQAGGHLTVAEGAKSLGPVNIESSGKLSTACENLAGPGSFTLQAGAIMEICHPGGLVINGSSGGIQLTGTKNISPGATFVYNGTVAQITGSGLPATISNLTVNNAAGLTNSQPLNVSRLLTLADGNFITGNQLTLTSNAQGTAMVTNTSTGRITGLVNVQRYIKPSPFAGVAERYISTPVAVQQLNQLSAVVGSFAPVLNTAYNNAVDKRAVTPYPNVFTYDHNRTITGGLYNGWFVPTGGMDPTKGYSLRVAGGTVLQTRGNLSLDSRTITGTNTTAEALLLLGNPFPNPIDWNFMSRTGIYNAYYTWQPTTGGAGRYASYVNGIGTYGATNIIPMGVGFFVSTSTTSPRLALPNACRVTSYANPTTFRQQARPMLRLSMRPAADSLNYETVLYFDTTATAGFDGEKDAQHLGGSTSIYSHGNGQSYAINGQPLSLLNDGMMHTFPLGFTAANAGTYFIKASEMTELGGQPILLIDNQLQTTTLLQPGQSYQFQTPAGNNHSRFQIQLGYSATSAKASLSSQLSIYPNPAKDLLEVSGLGSNARIRLLNSIGQQVVTTTASFSAMLDIEALAAGVYTLQIEQDGQVVNQRVVKQ